MSRNGKPSVSGERRRSMVKKTMPAPGRSDSRHTAKELCLQSSTFPRISQSLNRRQAIRKRCLDCSGFIPSEVRNCEFEDCPLHPFRSGRGKQSAVAREKAIREYCLVWCMLNQPVEVSLCPSVGCQLYPYRNTSAPKSKNVHIRENTEGAFQPEGGRYG